MDEFLAALAQALKDEFNFLDFGGGINLQAPDSTWAKVALGVAEKMGVHEWSSQGQNMQPNVGVILYALPG